MNQFFLVDLIWRWIFMFHENSIQFLKTIAIFMFSIFCKFRCCISFAWANITSDFVILLYIQPIHLLLNNRTKKKPILIETSSPDVYETAICITFRHLFIAYWHFLFVLISIDILLWLNFYWKHPHRINRISFTVWNPFNLINFKNFDKFEIISYMQWMSQDLIEHIAIWHLIWTLISQEAKKTNETYVLGIHWISNKYILMNVSIRCKLLFISGCVITLITHFCFFFLLHFLLFIYSYFF